MSANSRDKLAREVEMLRARLVELERQRPNSAEADRSSEADATSTSLEADEIAFPYQALDANGRLLSVNAAWQTLFGYAEANAIGKSFAELLAPASAETFQRCFAQVKAEDTERREEFEILRKDGNRIWVAVAGTIVRHAHGGIRQVHCVLHDITQRKEAEATLAARNRQLEAVRTLSEEITRELDVTTLLRLIVDRAVEIVGAAAGVIYLWDAEQQLLIPRAWRAHGDWIAQLRLRLGEGVTGIAGQRREGLIVNDYRSSPYALPLLLERVEVTASLAEPLLYRDRLLGAIVANHIGSPRRFTEEDQHTLRLFAAQAAIAIENARLYEGAQGELLERKLAEKRLARLNECLLSFEADSQANINRLVALCGEELGAACALYNRLVDGRLCAWGHWNTPADFPPADKPDGHICYDVIRSGRSDPWVIRDLPQTAYAETDPAVRRYGLQTYVGKAVSFDGTAVGSLCAVFQEDRLPTTEDLKLLGIASSAIGVEEKRRRAEEGLRTRTHQLETLRDVSTEIARELDLPTLLTLINRRAAELVGAASGTVRLWDEAAQVLVPAAWHGLGEWIRERRSRLGEGVSGTVAARRAGLIVNDYRTSPYTNPLTLEQTEITAILAEPLLYRDRLLGVISVGIQRGERSFTEEDHELLGLFATQAAVAIENARLYAEVNQSYQDLQQAQDELLRSEKLRALGQMAAGIAHDLNNTLAAILGQAELLQLRVTDPQIQTGLAMVGTAAKDGANVVRRLQDFARQRGPAPQSPVVLKWLVQETLELARPRWKDEAQRRGAPIQVITRFEDCAPIRVHASELREALMNLIVNAVDAMPTGGTLTLTTGSSAPGWVDLAVADTGVGMTEEVRGRIFEPFFTTKGLHGTGLGLSVVYGIVERHEGQIAVSSAPGQGTTVSLRFPAADAVPPTPSRPTDVASTSPRTLLLIDDEVVVRQTLGELLRAAGHTVFEANSGSHGLEVLRQHAIHCVLTDLGMPEMTGWEVARAVKVSCPGMPVILLTGWGESQAASAPEGALVDRILAKPVRFADLAATIQAVTETPAVDPG